MRAGPQVLLTYSSELRSLPFPATFALPKGAPTVSPLGRRSAAQVRSAATGRSLLGLGSGYPPQQSERCHARPRPVRRATGSECPPANHPRPRCRARRRMRRTPGNRSVLEMKRKAEMQGERWNAAKVQLDYGDRPYLYDATTWPSTIWMSVTLSGSLSFSRFSGDSNRRSAADCRTLEGSGNEPSEPPTGSNFK